MFKPTKHKSMRLHHWRKKRRSCKCFFWQMINTSFHFILWMIG